MNLGSNYDISSQVHTNASWYSLRKMVSLLFSSIKRVEPIYKIFDCSSIHMLILSIKSLIREKSCSSFTISMSSRYLISCDVIYMFCHEKMSQKLRFKKQNVLSFHIIEDRIPLNATCDDIFEKRKILRQDTQEEHIGPLTNLIGIVRLSIGIFFFL